MDSIQKMIEEKKRILEKGVPYIQEIGEKIVKGDELSDDEKDALLAAKELVSTIKSLQDSIK
jgi:hypothetical protein